MSLTDLPPDDFKNLHGSGWDCDQKLRELCFDAWGVEWDDATPTQRKMIRDRYPNLLAHAPDWMSEE